jgi:hypothetical protein
MVVKLILDQLTSLSLLSRKLIVSSRFLSAATIILLLGVTFVGKEINTDHTKRIMWPAFGMY